MVFIKAEIRQNFFILPMLICRTISLPLYKFSLKLRCF